MRNNIADIELVIKIPEEDYKKIIEYGECDYLRIINAIENGILIPEGHGRIVDTKNFKYYLNDSYIDSVGFTRAMYAISKLKTIIPADKEVEE